ncbi:MAG: FliG C-terminal domain-containing protein [Paracoccaceae bacterium]
MMDLVPLAAAPGLPVGGGFNSHVDSLSRRAKAAIVVRLLLNEGSEVPLEELPEACQEELTKAMGQMRVVDKDTVASVVEEFASEVDRIGLRFPGGIAGALSALDGKINPMTAARLRKEAGVRESGDPWARVRDLGIETLRPVVENESIEVSAVLLSKLDTKKAADLLGNLPGPQARQIAYAVSQTASVTPEAVDRIGLSLATQLSAQPLRAFDEDPVERVGAILNSSTSITREDVLEGLDERDEGFATAVRKAIFTFGNIPKRIAPRDIPRILREIDQAALITALAGAADAGMQSSSDYIFENMSARMADQLREEAADREKPKPAETEEAMATIIDSIRALEKSGELMLISEED